MIFIINIAVHPQQSCRVGMVDWVAAAEEVGGNAGGLVGEAVHGVENSAHAEFETGVIVNQRYSEPRVGLLSGVALSLEAAVAALGHQLAERIVVIELLDGAVGLANQPHAPLMVAQIEMPAIGITIALREMQGVNQIHRMIFHYFEDNN